MVEYLNEQVEAFFQSLPFRKEMQWLKNLGLWRQKGDYRLTQADVYQLVAILLCTNGILEYEGDEKQTIKLGEFIVPMPIFTAFEQSLHQLLPYFVISRITQQNRKFFLQSYHLKDQSISKKLEAEVNRLKQELTREKETNTDLKLLLSQQKDTCEKANKIKIKDLESTLIMTLKEKERLAQEILDLKEACGFFLTFGDKTLYLI